MLTIPGNTPLDMWMVSPELALSTAGWIAVKSHPPGHTVRVAACTGPAASSANTHDLEGYRQKQITGRRIREVE
jgi:hypothetical protein